MTNRTTDDGAQIDLTPMLDVVFILLVFFVVFASFTKERVLPLQSSHSETSSEAGQSLVLRVTERNQIYHGSRKIDAAAVRSYVARIRAEMGGVLSLVVVAHPFAAVSSYAGIADSARRSGVTHIAIMKQAATK